MKAMLTNAQKLYIVGNKPPFVFSLFIVFKCSSKAKKQKLRNERKEAFMLKNKSALNNGKKLQNVKCCLHIKVPKHFPPIYV